MAKKTIQNLERIEQPREKLQRYGADKLSGAELLAIVLRSGTKGNNVLEVAKKILKTFPGSSLVYATIAELIKIAGVGPVKALEIQACFELGRRFLQAKQAELVLSPQQVWEKMQDVRSSKKEQFVVFYLDTQNQIVQREVISIGILNASLIHPREVFEAAIKHVASHIIVAHNHPSGSLEPSDEDLSVTRRLISSGLLLGIHVLDHVIVTKTNFYSFKEHGYISVATAH